MSKRPAIPPFLRPRLMAHRSGGAAWWHAVKLRFLSEQHAASPSSTLLASPLPRRGPGSVGTVFVLPNEIPEISTVSCLFPLLVGMMVPTKSSPSQVHVMSVGGERAWPSHVTVKGDGV